jgi:type II secretory pathway pseudopilin PulG
MNYKRERNEDGFSLVEITITTVVSGLIGTAIFAMFMSFNSGNLQLRTAAEQNGATIVANATLQKEIRNATAYYILEDESALYLRDQEGEVDKWEVSDEGLTNGTRVIEGVTEAHFSHGLNYWIKYDFSVGDADFESKAKGRVLDHRANLGYDLGIIKDGDPAHYDGDGFIPGQPTPVTAGR